MTLWGWLYASRDDKVRARTTDAFDRGVTDPAHKFIVEVGKVKIPLTRDQAADLYGDLHLAFWSASEEQVA